MRRSFRVGGVMAMAAVAACRPTSNAAASEDAGARIEVPRRVALGDAPVVAADHDAAVAATDGSTPVTSATAAIAHPPQSSAVVLDHAAGADSRRILGVGGGALYRLDGDHWQRLAFTDAEPRDVTYMRGVFYVLARGTGPNAGHALILRTTRGDDLSVAHAPQLDADSDPRVLVTVRDGAHLIAGAHPALAMVSESGLSVLARDLAPVISARLMRDDTIIARHGGEDLSLVRYGSVTPMTVADYLDTVVDSNGTSYMVHEHGEFSRGRPGREYSAATTPTPFEPRIVAAFAGERLIAVGAGGPFASWQRHEWHLVQGNFPRDPIAIIPSEPMVVVGRDGAVTVADPAGARVVVEPPHN